ncbi:hypothetical protein [Spongiactinospora sp. TRM90649]|uniref:hypothetical protein n=1 Tax=Spongiactinospora sp. TRM90649 TaxID=3031114 RepID=UPI0023F9C2D4|nr:hypothetical protein [Spongiactinospora sp. TRM90649]MDF5756299.1 hypothetical protein [Spongiactinospora sp. TRM90649]
MDYLSGPTPSTPHATRIRGSRFQVLGGVRRRRSLLRRSVRVDAVAVPVVAAAFGAVHASRRRVSG